MSRTPMSDKFISDFDATKKDIEFLKHMAECLKPVQLSYRKELTPPIIRMKSTNKGKAGQEQDYQPSVGVCEALRTHVDELLAMHWAILDNMEDSMAQHKENIRPVQTSSPENS